MSAKGKGKAWAIRQWELETINALGWTETQWCELGLAERYRKVCALKLGAWMQSLEAEEQIKRIKAK